MDNLCITIPGYSVIQTLLMNVLCSFVFYRFYQGIWFADLLGLQAGIPVIPAGLAAAPQPSLPPVATQPQEPAEVPLNPLFQGEEDKVCVLRDSNTHTHTHTAE